MFKFTSESVSEGHPDKLCDQISDAILDAFLSQDPHARVAVETFASKNLIIVAGEVRSSANLDYEAIARQTALDIGYDAPEKGLDGRSCRFICNVQQQSPDIAQGVDVGSGKFKEQGAGDQGIMFGYACNQTKSLMPLPLEISHHLMQRIQDLRKSKQLNYLRPDAKSQVTVHYENNQAKFIDTVVVSTQHDESIDYDALEKDVIENVIKPVVPKHLLSESTRYLINPTGRFVLGGPEVDTGLTGRKIIVDTYGGWAQHGGGAFSGKDPSKVDRSAAYMARYIAKNLVAAKLCDEVLIQLSYAIGFAEPVSVYIDTKGTAVCSEKILEEAVRKVFDLTPAGIVNQLNLKRPIFKKSASLGHFGRDVFPWEKVDQIEALNQLILPKMALA